MKTQCIIGAAGTGKSYLLKQRIEAGEKMLLTSTTGISAVNLGAGVTTIHSALGFYDLRSLQFAHSHGYVRQKFIALAKKGIKTVVIDEMSMLQGEALQLIHQGAVDAQMLLEDRARDVNHIRDANGRYLTGEDATGLLLCGDYLQLPPIGERKADGKPGDAQYAFEAPCWAGYETPENMTHLKKVWRQDDPRLLNALQQIRAGRGVDGAFDLKAAGVEFVEDGDDNFDGITLFAINQQVDAFNARRLGMLSGSVVTIPSERWGKERSEWKIIPEILELKDKALVMILANDSPEFRYVNGDLATFNVADRIAEDNKNDVWKVYSVETKRGYRGPIPFTIRRNISFTEPEEQAMKNVYLSTPWGKRLDSMDRSEKAWYAIYREYVDAHVMKGKPYYDPAEQGVVIGEIEYMPLRVAYASTVHKVQGLTLDNVQCNINHYWFGNASMCYVALTRARSVGGLRIVGDVQKLSKRIKTDVRVRRWI